MWGQPGAIVLCAGGFSFYGERKWLNRRVFCVDPERVIKTVSTQCPGQRFYAGRPGQTFHMDKGVVQRVDKQAPFLSMASPSTWPVREKEPMTTFPDYAPASGQREPLSAEDRARLQQRLDEFAAFLVGGYLFKSLHSLMEIEGEGRRVTFAFVLRQGEKEPPLTYVYDSRSCSFQLVPGDNPRQLFLAGMECWAADLLAVLSGELGWLALLFGRASLWNMAPQRLNFTLFDELQRISHPLRCQAAFLRNYERILKSCGEQAPTVLSRSA
jgi:hypothetical protein